MPIARRSVALSLIVLACGSGAAQAPGSSESVGESLERLDRTVTTVRFGAPLDEWQQTHPNATCRAYHPHGQSRPEPDDEWCSVCEERDGNQTREWAFYLLRPDLPLACRLEQVRVSVDGPPQLVEQVHATIAERIAARRGAPTVTEFGAPDAHGIWTTSRSDVPREFGINFWRGIHGWVADDAEIYAYVYDNTYDKLPIRATVWMRDGQFKQRALARRQGGFGGVMLWHEVTEAVRPMHPDLAFALSHLRVAHRPEQNQPLRRAIQRALDAAAKAPVADKGLFLLAANHLAHYLPFTFRDGLKEDDRSLRSLRAAGITFEPSPYDDPMRLRSSESLLELVAKRYPGTRWGDLAALEILRSCDNDEERFKAVIEQAPQFLASRPNSPYRLDAMFALADAYETWWSLAQAVEEVEVEKFQPGAEDARRQAIAVLQRIVEVATEPRALFEARFRIAQLSLNVDTGQRAFYCPYP